MRRDHQVRKGLIVLEIFVMARLDVFNQATLGQQSIDFAVAEHEVDIGDLMDPFGRSNLLSRRRQEITSRSRPKILGLANVDDNARRILHQIHARRLRKLANFFSRPPKSQVSVEQIVDPTFQFQRRFG